MLLHFFRSFEKRKFKKIKPPGHRARGFRIYFIKIFIPTYYCGIGVVFLNIVSINAFFSASDMLSHPVGSVILGGII